MILFDIVFPLAMLLLPILAVYIYRPADPIEDPNIQRRIRRLVFFTLLCVGFFAALAIPRLVGQTNWSERLPWFMTLGFPLDQLTWSFFFPLWFGLAMPLVRAMRPELLPGGAETGPVRTASLVSRRTLPTLPKWAGWPPMLLCVAGMGVYLARQMDETPIPDRYHGLALLTLALTSLGLFTVPLVRLGILADPEPMDPANSAELAEAYARYRNDKSVGLYGFGLIMQACLVGFATWMLFGVMEKEGVSQTVGLIGGIAGSTIGMAGGGFGAWMGHRRMQIEKLRQSLSPQAPKA